MKRILIFDHFPQLYTDSGACFINANYNIVLIVAGTYILNIQVPDGGKKEKYGTNACSYSVSTVKCIEISSLYSH